MKQVLTLLMISTSIMGALNPLPLLGKKKWGKESVSTPVFSNVEYTGEDSVYTNNPLGEGEFYNPILQGCYPDPSICRKGKDYYLVCSSFAMMPGAPIFHSRDLVNWEQLGHVLDRPSQLPVSRQGTSGGMMAPAISYNPHNDTFYMITTAGGNFVVKAKNPAGPWSERINLGFNGIDPSLFFDDDGKAYIVHNDAPKSALWSGHRIIRMWEYDVENDRLVSGSDHVIVNGGTKFQNNPYWIEAPHLYKHKGKYYLMCAEGGTGDTHSEVIFMSDKVTGPYIEAPSNPILSQRHLASTRKEKVDWAGHVDLVLGPDGKYYAVFLAVRPNHKNLTVTGRETFLLPVDWSGTWPVFENGLMPIGPKLKLPNGVKNLTGTAHYLPQGNFSWRDALKVQSSKSQSPKLHNRWFGLRTLIDSVARCTPRGLQLLPNENNITQNRPLSAAWIRQQHKTFSFATDIAYLPATATDIAGIACIQSSRYNYVFGLVRQKEELCLVVQCTTAGKSQTIASQPINLKGTVRLRVAAVDGDQYQFSYSIDKGRTYRNVGKPVSGDILSTNVAGGFVGCMLGLYATTNNNL